MLRDDDFGEFLLRVVVVVVAGEKLTIRDEDIVHHIPVLYVSKCSQVVRDKVWNSIKTYTWPAAPAAMGVECGIAH